MAVEETLPEGVRDYVGEDARLHRFLEHQLSETMQAWNYQEIITPSLELYEQLYPGVGRRMLRRSFKLTDWRGRILALRPEMTTPIARAASLLFGEDPGPHRLYYRANVFRIPPAGEGWLSEYFQAGGELLGVPGAPGDAEAMAVALESMGAAGFSQLQVGIGHMAFLRSVLRDLDLDEEAQERVIECLRERNLVKLEQVLEESYIGENRRQFLWELVTRSGNGDSRAMVEELSRRVGEAARPQLEDLQELFELLHHFGWGENAYLDLGIVRSLDYYTGVIFEIYGPGLGRPLGGGGRYDGLLQRFGADLPATGFALGFPELMTLFRYQGLTLPQPSRDYLVASVPSARARAMARARELRAQGCTVELDLAGSSREDSLARAQKAGFRNLLFFDSQSEAGAEEQVPLY